MKILVTGAKGFIGRNLVAELNNRKIYQVFEFDKENSLADLAAFTKECDFVCHLAGVNRPKEEKEFTVGNRDFTKTLLENLKQNNNKAPIIFTSSTQAALENPYGKSKLEAESVLMDYSNETGIPVTVYRLPGVFGKWCRPSYNSVVATFCHNIAHGLPVKVNDPAAEITLVYIDDVISEFLNSIQNLSTFPPYRLNTIPSSLFSSISLSSLVMLLESFKRSREDKSLPAFSDHFARKLYATYLSYLPVDEFGYELKMNIDNRGSFTEFLKTPDRGQISVNISNPGIVKGNHWHHTKNEKFLVVSGDGVIRFRKIGTTEVIEYKVSGEKLEVVDIPPGYTHNIQNIGGTDMVTVMWASEVYDPDHPDTWIEDV